MEKKVAILLGMLLMFTISVTVDAYTNIFYETEFYGQINMSEQGIINASYIEIATSDTSDPILYFVTTNNEGHNITIRLDENALDDLLTIAGHTLGNDTQLRIVALDGQNSELRLYSGNTNFGFIKYTSGDVLRIQNDKQNEDIIFGIDDGGVPKTITWDASTDTLEHSHGEFNLDDDNLTTTGNGTFGDSVFSDFYRNSTGDLEWIGPEHIADVDLEDICGADACPFPRITGDDAIQGDFDWGGYGITNVGELNVTDINVTDGNITVQTGFKICFDGAPCTKFAWDNGTRMIWQG